MNFGETLFERPFTVLTEKNPTPTVHVIYKKLKEIYAGISYEFPYRQTTLYHLLKRLSVEHRKTDNRQVIMETFQIILWRWEYF